MPSQNPAAARMRLALEMFDLGVEMRRQQLRRAFPDASEEELRRRIGQWLRKRPGAEFGDSAGRPVPWPRPPRPR